MSTQGSAPAFEDRMPASCFEYQRAETWADAVELLGLWRGEAKILAGGQSLVPMLNLRLACPAALIDVGRIPTAEPQVVGEDLVIEANTRHRVLTTSTAVATQAPLLAHAARLIGNVRVRNRGTLGGSLAHADPTAEIGAVALAMGGEVTVLGPQGHRDIPVEQFFVTYLTTALAHDEVVTGLRLRPAGTARWGFHESVRRYSDFATVSVSVLARSGTAGPSLRVVLGGVADRPLLVDQELLQPALRDPGNPTAAREAAQGIADSLDPESDLHASADYRRRLVAVHTRRLLEHTLGSSADEVTAQ